jgi:predicted aspartyl protease
MRSKGSNSMGRFSVNFEITNYRDLVLPKSGHLEPDKIRRQTISGVVDPGAAMLVLPQSLVKELGLPMRNNIQVRYADGRRAKRREAQDAHVELLGRDGNFAAIVEPKRTSALIGAIVLEQLDLLVDCQPQRLIPRDPSGPIYEIE